MRRELRLVVVLAMVVLSTGPIAQASAQVPPECSRVVMVALPGITWHDIDRWRPPELGALADRGAIGSVSIRTVTSRTTYASGFATIGAGNRLDGGRTTGGPAGTEPPAPSSGFVRDLFAGGLEELMELAEEADYGAIPGALGRALGPIPVQAIGNADIGIPPPAPTGYGRWTLLAAMDATGIVDRAATSSLLLRRDPAAPYGVRTDPDAFGSAVEEGLELECAVTIIDQGDGTRADRLSESVGAPLQAARRAALLAADGLVGDIAAGLDPARDLLLVVSPTSPGFEDDNHFGIAIAVGRSFPAGTSLESATTRRRGLVTLVDVAPTVLAHLDIARSVSMNGREWFAVDAPDPALRMEEAIDLDRESVFVDDVRTPIVTGFVVFQIVAYILIAVLYLRERKIAQPTRKRLFSTLEQATLAVVAFPVATYLVGVVSAHDLGTAGYVATLIAIDLVLLMGVGFALRNPLDRVLALTAFTTAVLFADLMLGSRLQVNTVLSYSPIVAGRFAGIGNIAFAVLAGATLLTGTLLVQRWPRSRAALVVTALLFAGAVVVDGAPAFGSDVGGVITLVPAFAITLGLLTGRAPNLRFVVVGIFLALDLARPEASRTHLARLWEDVRLIGPSALVDVIERKVRTNLRVFTTTIWTYAVPPALVAISYLLLRPRGRWQRLAVSYPKLRAGLVGALILAAIGFAFNDSGIVIPAVILSFLVPIALLIHMYLEEGLHPSSSEP